MLNLSGSCALCAAAPPRKDSWQGFTTVAVQKFKEHKEVKGVGRSLSLVEKCLNIAKAEGERKLTDRLSHRTSVARRLWMRTREGLQQATSVCAVNKFAVDVPAARPLAQIRDVGYLAFVSAEPICNELQATSAASSVHRGQSKFGEIPASHRLASCALSQTSLNHTHVNVAMLLTRSVRLRSSRMQCAASSALRSGAATVPNASALKPEEPARWPTLGGGAWHVHLVALRSSANVIHLSAVTKTFGIVRQAAIRSGCD